jgi:hypothetical protein
MLACSPKLFVVINVFPATRQKCKPEMQTSGSHAHGWRSRLRETIGLSFLFLFHIYISPLRLLQLLVLFFVFRIPMSFSFIKLHELRTSVEDLSLKVHGQAQGMGLSMLISQHLNETLRRMKKPITITPFIWFQTMTHHPHARVPCPQSWTVC